MQLCIMGTCCRQADSRTSECFARPCIQIFKIRLKYHKMLNEVDSVTVKGSLVKILLARYLNFYLKHGDVTVYPWLIGLNCHNCTPTKGHLQVMYDNIFADNQILRITKVQFLINVQLPNRDQRFFRRDRSIIPCPCDSLRSA